MLDKGHFITGEYMMNNLQKIRQQNGYTQKELSDKTDISLNMITKYEQQYKDINGAKLRTLLKLCLALNCNLSDILDDKETLELLSSYYEANLK